MASKLIITDQQRRDSLKKAGIIVEDDPGNAEVLDLLLQVEDAYQITDFSASEEVLANLDIIQTLQPALFIFDYQLPVMTGLDLSRQLHTTNELEKVPALILSGSRISDEQKEQMLHQGLIFIPKPYDINDLLATIEQVVG